MALLSSQPSRSHHPAFVLSGPRAGRRPGTAHPPGSELPPSPCRGRRSRAPTRRGRAWTTAGSLPAHPLPHGDGHTQREPPSKRLKTEVLGSAEWAHTWLPARWGGASCRGPALSQHEITDGPFFLWAEGTVAIVSPPPPTAPPLLGAWARSFGGSGTAERGRWRPEGQILPRLRYLLPKSALGLDLWVDGTSLGGGGKNGAVSQAHGSFLATRPEKGGGGRQAPKAGHPPHGPVTPPLPCASPPEPEERRLGVTAQAYPAQLSVPHRGVDQRSGPCLSFHRKDGSPRGHSVGVGCQCHPPPQAF